MTVLVASPGRAIIGLLPDDPGLAPAHHRLLTWPRSTPTRFGTSRARPIQYRGLFDPSQVWTPGSGWSELVTDAAIIPVYQDIASFPTAR